MNEYHTSVLVKEVIAFLNVRAGKKYIDATLGGGGHSMEILKRGGRVLGIDADQEALTYTKKRLETENIGQKIVVGRDAVLIKGNFKDIDEIARQSGFNDANGVLFDLGVSSHQLDTGERGFSFGRVGELDMRMDRDLAVRAKDLLNGLGKDELTELFLKYGEEKFAARIARNIVKERLRKPIETTEELGDIIKRSVFITRSEIHPATRVFQALRIAVNDELNNLREALPKCLELLVSGGVIVVISFHSLEDRIVKQTFNDFSGKKLGEILTTKPVEPTEEEKTMNQRSRSAKLRVFEKK